MVDVMYRVVELRPDTDGRVLVLCPVYVEDGRIIGSADPYECDLVGSDEMSLIRKVHSLHGALCLPTLSLSDLPGSDEFVDPAQREPLPASLIESLSSPGTIEHPSDPSPPIESGGPGDVEAAGDPAVFEDLSPYWIPDPDRQHDDMWVDLGGEG